MVVAYLLTSESRDQPSYSHEKKKERLGLLLLLTGNEVRKTRDPRDGLLNIHARVPDGRRVLSYYMAEQNVLPHLSGTVYLSEWVPQCRTHTVPLLKSG